MTREELISRLVNGGTRQPRSPLEARGTCPTCNKKGLGNTYTAHGGKSYRQCKYCSEAC